MKIKCRLVEIETLRIKKSFYDSLIGVPEGFLVVPVELYDKEVVVIDGVVVEKLPTPDELQLKALIDNANNLFNSLPEAIQSGLKNIREDVEKYALSGDFEKVKEIIEGVATIYPQLKKEVLGFILLLATTDSEKLSIQKQIKLIDLETYVLGKQYFDTSVGKLGLNTIAGNLATAMTGLIVANLPDYSGMFFTYDGLVIENLTNENFKALYGEVLLKYTQADAAVRDIKSQIEACDSLECLNNIAIEF